MNTVRGRTGWQQLEWWIVEEADKFRAARFPRSVGVRDGREEELEKWKAGFAKFLLDDGFAVKANAAVGCLS